MRWLSLMLVLSFLGLNQAWAQPAPPPFKVGETITYSIKKFGLGGTATLTYQGHQPVNGKDALLIVFKADGFNFYDEEKIFVDPVTFTPITVLRDINIWGKKEKITEEYLPQQGQIKITKLAGDHKTVQTIEKKPPVDNIYGVIYRYRQSGTFKTGDQLQLRLPTLDVTLRLLKTDDIKAAGKKYEAYYMESDPSQFKVWFDKSQQKIPLKITSEAGFGSTTMTMTGYQAGKSPE